MVSGRVARSAARVRDTTCRTVAGNASRRRLDPSAHTPVNAHTVFELFDNYLMLPNFAGAGKLPHGSMAH